MRIVVIGGTGLVGSKVVRLLREQGHDAVAASPNTGVNTLTGEGLAEVLTGAGVVVDVSNSPSLDGDAAQEFFKTATPNLLGAERAAGVGHHVALSVVGTEELAESRGYFKAKLAQEQLIAESGIPYTIVHATQFFEFVNGIADEATDGDTVRLAPAYFQPMASADVAQAVASAAVSAPVNGITEIGGPQRVRLDELIKTALAARNDPRTVVADPAAGYWGAPVGEYTLTPGEGATLYETRFEDWVRESAAV
ncbi:NmrA family transcriptional regulator [Mycolicibacterium agri]|uniref:LysR family transcriptional regulator n=1 Tax=Mycolicibacterium agri TaxID=36811 RepID=A0A2A7MWY6_MYCAG|nr:SDR family oxidoreductase [Mycolicibacterium agri]PEG36070.1 NmrA family transcriptional regulator [Mycolicibacterium agri]GFG54341.1 LysR family transcriptional regulator [Mycolicibacterium agri]